MASFASLPYKTVSHPVKQTCLISTSSFSSNTEVYRTTPECSILYTDHVSTTCNSCYSSTDLTFSCTDCKSYTLCTSCATAAKTDSHSAGECKLFLAVPPGLRTGDTDYLRFFLRYFVYRTAAPGSKELRPCPFKSLVDLPTLQSKENISWSNSFADVFMQVSESSKASCSKTTVTPRHYSSSARNGPLRTSISLVHCTNDQRPASLDRSLRFPACFFPFADSAISQNAPPPAGITKADLVSMLLKLRVNDLGFPFNNATTLGWCLSSVVCLQNHSCEPSTRIERVDGQLSVVANADLAEGAELTISYINLDDPQYKSVIARREALLEKYCFECSCDRCVKELQLCVTIKLQVPEGATPGCLLNVNVNGGVKQVRVPEGAKGGDEIRQYSHYS